MILFFVLLNFGFIDVIILYQFAQLEKNCAKLIKFSYIRLLNAHFFLGCENMTFVMFYKKRRYYLCANFDKGVKLEL